MLRGTIAMLLLMIDGLPLLGILISQRGVVSFAWRFLQDDRLVYDLIDTRFRHAKDNY